MSIGSNCVDQAEFGRDAKFWIFLNETRLEELRKAVTQNFQSCTFNRSVTSPCLNFKYLYALPSFPNRQCLQNVSNGRIEAFFERTIRKVSGQRRIAKLDSLTSHYTIKSPVIKKNISSLAYLLGDVSTMSPQWVEPRNG